MLPDVRMARIVEAVTRYRVGGMSCYEAAGFPGMSERHFRRGNSGHLAMMACADRGPNQSSVLAGQASLGVTRFAWRRLPSPPLFLPPCLTRWLARREPLSRLRLPVSRQALSRRGRYASSRAIKLQAAERTIDSICDGIAHTLNTGTPTERKKYS